MLLKATRTLLYAVILALGFILPYPLAQAETLNPEGINPHAEAPRKRITQEQRLAAAKAMKKKKAEIEARRAAESRQRPANLPAHMPTTENGSDSTAK